MRIASFIIGFILFFTACTERVICPAYQSAFIHDKDVVNARFSYFREDSTPKIRDTDKGRFLLVEPVAYEKRIREMQTIEMQDVYPIPDDSLAFDQDLMLAERDVVDSTQLSADAGELHPGLKGPFNTDQELYMYYLRDILLLPDARAAYTEQAEQKNISKRQKRRQKKAEEKEEKEKKGPFSIFGGKDKDAEREEEQQSEEEDGSTS
jgi:hypothetical protein